MAVDGDTFCPGYVFTSKTYCPGTKCLTEILLLALPFQQSGAQFIISPSMVYHQFIISSSSVHHKFIMSSFNYTLSCIAYTIWYYTEDVKLLHRKVQIFYVQSGKNYTGQKKFTQTPSVASVTNIRYRCV